MVFPFHGSGAAKTPASRAEAVFVSLSARRLALQAAAFDDPGEVLEILPHCSLEIRDGFRHEFPDLAAGRVGVVHRDNAIERTDKDLCRATKGGRASSDPV